MNFFLLNVHSVDGDIHIHNRLRNDYVCLCVCVRICLKHFSAFPSLIYVNVSGVSLGNRSTYSHVDTNIHAHEHNQANETFVRCDSVEAMTTKCKTYTHTQRRTTTQRTEKGRGTQYTSCMKYIFMYAMCVGLYVYSK